MSVCMSYDVGFINTINRMNCVEFVINISREKIH